MQTFLFILITLVILTVLVVAHEFGHYLAAKKAGVYVIEFAVGMGPKLFEHRGAETRFTVRAFPIGGFCRMYGELEDEDDEDVVEEDLSDIPQERSFLNLPKGKKLLVLLAGVAMNFLFGYLLIFSVYLAHGRGLLVAFTQSARTFGIFAGAIYASLAMLFTGKLGINDFAGPVGMVGMVGTYAAHGFGALIFFTALISVNLGIFNLLPLPALDGGQAVITFIEWITGKNIDPKKVGWINGIGFAALMVFAMVVAVNDVFRYLR